MMPSSAAGCFTTGIDIMIGKHVRKGHPGCVTESGAPLVQLKPEKI